MLRARLAHTTTPTLTATTGRDRSTRNDAYWPDRLGTSNVPTEAINGRLEHLRGSLGCGRRSGVTLQGVVRRGER